MRLNVNIVKLAISLISLMAFSFCDAQTLPESHIQTLAASCAACHGALGNPVKNAENQSKVIQLAGIHSDRFIQQMQDFKSGARASTVMHHHAKGLTNEEVSALALFFSKQKVKTIQILPTQVYLMLVGAD